MNDLLNRFIASVESIAASLAVIAGGAGVTGKVTVEGPAATPAAEGKETKPRATRTAKADKAPDAAPVAAAAATPEPETKPAAEPAKPETPAFDYEELKKAIIALASAGEAGKEAAVRILTDAGLNRGQKASDAPAAKWPGMHKQAVDALAAINAGGEFA